MHGTAVSVPVPVSQGWAVPVPIPAWDRWAVPVPQHSAASAQALHRAAAPGAQLNPGMAQRVSFPRLSSSRNLSLPQSFRSPQGLTSEHIQDLKEDLACELAAEVSLAITICAERVEDLVISIHGIS